MGELDFHTPTPIQYESIPKLLDGQDLLGIAQTGTGKTAAFVLPLLHRLAAEDNVAERKRPRALILVPTRELAVQV
ncbi:MAG: DEAD/DEAH box helicase, partial [SAR324 cluster bacterium]|nr:DEAD/DEAH box helicase [SAR324 cluster bacterium]